MPVPHYVLDIAKIILALAFLFYGYACIATPAMVSEFSRYGIPKMRKLIGWLEVAGGVGIIVGYQLPIIGYLATGGLALLMLGGVGLRVTLGDKWTQIVPAAFFLIMSSLILYASLI